VPRRGQRLAAAFGPKVLGLALLTAIGACADGAERDLSFLGVDLADGVSAAMGPFTTAVGGRQQVTVLPGRPGEPALPAFSAKTEGASLAVSGVSGRRVTVLAKAPGSTFLEILDDTGARIDRWLLDADDVQRVEVVPLRSELRGDLELLRRIAPDVVFHEERPAARLAVAYYGRLDQRLVDEAAIVDAAGAAPGSGAWDSFLLADPLVGTFPVSITVGGRPFATSYTVVADVDALVWVPSDFDERAPERGLALGDGATYCFRATSGGRAVIGAPITFSATDILIDLAFGPCVAVYATTETDATVTVSSGPISLTVTIPVAAAP
jgi:hypothetical protein